MTAVTAEPTTTTTTVAPRVTLGVALSDAAAITRRYLTHIVRQPQLLVFSTVQPVMFVLLFRYVFGGALRLPPEFGDNYSNFLLPGIFVQTVAFGATGTAIAIADDLGKGVIDRFRSLPMARSAVLV